MASKLPQGYAEIDGCHNCTHRFVWTEHDCREEAYCTLAAPPRPPCGSLALNECFFYSVCKDGTAINKRPSDAEVKLGFERWEAWSRDRGVAFWGKCDNWKMG